MTATTQQHELTRVEDDGESTGGLPAPRFEPIEFGDGDSALTTIARVAASGVGRETIQQLKELVEWQDRRTAEQAFNAAFSKAKRTFKTARQSGYNSFLQKPYSLLSDIDEASRKALSDNGLAWRHVITTDGEMTVVKCVLAHEQGHQEVSVMSERSDRMVAASAGKEARVNPMQSVKVVTSYLQRITLAGMLGIVSGEGDNDGNGMAGDDPITDEQAIQVREFVEQVVDDRPRFWVFVSQAARREITRAEDIPVGALPKVMDALRRKQKEKAGGGR